MSDYLENQVDNQPAPEEKNPGQTVFRVIAILFVIILTIVILSISEEIEAFTETIPGLGWFAYPAIFGVSIIANATIILPVPGVVLTSLFGSVFNPFLVAIAAGIGASIGEMSGYLAGFSGQGIIDNSRWIERIQSWMNKFGQWTILILAFIPNPLFDIAGMTAGVMKMKVTRFLFWCALGKILKMLVFALAGDWIASLL
ncbi:MAG: VTT domain-containing protein [Anaerolineae bacterium]|jgi:uncharacterized membrane protein YdjX (TVP38/TMEM64 family)|nr:VTT domain-containing protein [Anaerolineae bacterium]